MGLLKTITGKLFAVLLGLLAVFRRAACFLGRRRKNSGSLLPTTVNKYPVTSFSNDITQSVPGNEVELESWDNWGNDSMQSGMGSGDMTSSPTINNHYNNGGFTNRNPIFLDQNQTEEEQEQELDFFQGMEPSYIKTQKILIKKREEINTNSISSRLAVNTGALQESELGSWEESDTAWEADISEDLTSEAQEAIKEKRRQERERRTAEHQRRKYERDNQRVGLKGGTIGMKLS